MFGNTKSVIVYFSLRQILSDKIKKTGRLEGKGLHSVRPLHRKLPKNEIDTSHGQKMSILTSKYRVIKKNLCLNHFAIFRKLKKKMIHIHVYLSTTYQYIHIYHRPISTYHIFEIHGMCMYMCIYICVIHRTSNFNLKLYKCSV